MRGVQVMKKIKLPLEMANGVQVRTLEELKENWSLEKILDNYLNGKLVTWLNDRYYTDLAEKVTALADIHDNVELQKEICKIFGVEVNESLDIDINEINERNRRITLIKQYTDDESIWKNVEKVAFDQEELADLLAVGESIIYLCDNKFSIPLNIQNKKYVGLGNVEIQINSKEYVDFSKYGIELKNIHFNEEYEKLVNSAVTLYRKGEEFEKEEKYKEALEMYKKAGASGSSEGLFRVGKFYQEGREGVLIDYVLARDYYMQALNLGNEKAANNIGCLYYNAEGVTRDYGEALKWFKKAAELGNGDSCNSIGNMYLNGVGVEKNSEKAMAWYQKSADLGNNFAMANVGYMYRYYKFKEREAMEWYKKAANLGNTWAMNQIGDMYSHGWGSNAQDFYEAMRWFRKGAELGDGRSCAYVGDMYYNARGVSADYREAKRWYKKGAELGDKYAEQNYDNMCGCIAINGQRL